MKALSLSIIDHSFDKREFNRTIVQVLSKELSERAESSVGKFHSLKCDVTSETEVKNSFRWILSAHGPITILINNAGILGNCFWNGIHIPYCDSSFL